MTTPDSPSGLTQALAAYASAGLQYPMSATAMSLVQQGFLDTVAVTLAGRNEPVVRRLVDYVAAQGRAAGPCHILFASPGHAVTSAALINATAAHALDYDDVGLQGHPSTVLVPALLAEGERLGASGRQLLLAYQVGYEVWAELIARDRDLHHLKGWHPTAVFGVVAVAAAVVALRQLPADVAAHALGLAASHAGGLVANFGSMAKPFHAGMAAANGIAAVDLAQAGITAAPDALEHHAGYLAALSPKGQVDRSTPLRNLVAHGRLTELGLGVKKYPMCFATHRLIDGLLDLTRRHDLHPDAIARFDATVGVAQASMLRNHHPQTALEAKFSLEFALAAAVVARQVGLAQLDDTFVQHAVVQQLMRQVHISTTDSVSPEEPSLAEFDELTVTLKSGEVLTSGPIRFARGTLQRPLAPGEMQTKFYDCARALPRAEQDRLWHHWQALDHVADIRAVFG